MKAIMDILTMMMQTLDLEAIRWTLKSLAMMMCSACAVWFIKKLQLAFIKFTI